MLRDNYANDLHVFHADVRGFVANNREHIRRSEQAANKIQQLCLARFNEICADVYDEVRRRHALAIVSGLGDFDQLNALQPLASLHPDRNSARQKLSTLPTEGLAGLCMDLLIDLERRFPAMTEPPPPFQLDTEPPPPRYTPVVEHIPIALAMPDNWI